MRVDGFDLRVIRIEVRNDAADAISAGEDRHDDESGTDDGDTQHVFPLESGDPEDDDGGDDGHEGGSQIRDDDHEGQHRDGDEGLLQGALLIDDLRAARDEVGEKEDQRGLGELRGLERSEALELEPAVRARIGEVDEDQKAKNDSEPRKCPGGRVQAMVIAALEIHQDEERCDGPAELADDEVVGGDVVAKLGDGAGCAIEHDQAEADHGKDGKK